LFKSVDLSACYDIITLKIVMILFISIVKIVVSTISVLLQNRRFLYSKVLLHHFSIHQQKIQKRHNQLLKINVFYSESINYQILSFIESDFLHTAGRR